MLSGLDAKRYNFTQVIYDATGRIVDRSEGYLVVKKPRFRWQVLGPFPQTVLVTEEQIQVYDPDLEQLTVSPLRNNWTDVPLAVLLNQDEIGDHFQILSISNNEYRLIPNAEDALIASFKISFLAGQLKQVEVVDRVNQVTHVDFEPAEGEMIQSELFELDLPEETEIVQG